MLFMVLALELKLQRVLPHIVFIVNVLNMSIYKIPGAGFVRHT